LTLALFRIIEPDTGNISLDGLNTSTIGLLDLRRRLAIIPQDAALFEGTIRDNLDPGHVHDDTELWSVLGTFAPVTPATRNRLPLHLLCSHGALPSYRVHKTNLFGAQNTLG
jgi:ABC-type transport system involved in cytochrome bd biosynthesis fused ATPase/permease subunit